MKKTDRRSVRNAQAAGSAALKQRRLGSKSATGPAPEVVHKILLEDAGNAILTIDYDGRYLYANRMAACHTGISQQKMIGKHMADILPPRQARLYLARIRKAMDSGKRASHEIHLDTPQGKRWLQVSIQPLSDQHGQSTAVMIVASDITPRVLAQKELRRSNRRLQSILDNTWDLIFTVDAKGRFIFANKAAENVTGYSVKQLLTMHSREILPAHEHAVLQQRIKALLSGTTLSRPHMYEAIGAGDKRFFMEVTSRPIWENGRACAINSIARDVTARVLADKALADSERRLRSVLAASRDAVYVLDLTTRKINYMSPAAAMVSGFSPEQLIDHGFDWLVDRIHAQDRARVLHHVDQIAQGRQDTDAVVEFRWLNAEGEYRWFQDSQVLMFDETTGKRSLVGAIKDITRHRLAEEALRESEERMRAILSSLTEVFITVSDKDGRFLSVWAHDSMRDRYGERMDKWVGRKSEDLFGKRQAGLLLKSIRKVLATGQTMRVERRLAMPAGEFWFDTCLSVLRDSKGAGMAVVGFHVDITARKQAEGQAQAARLALLSAREEERRRVARELHDSVGQQVVAAKLSILNIAEMCRQCKDPSARHLIGKLADRLGDLVQEIRQISHGLYPGTLESLGLATALMQMSDDLSGRFAVRVVCGVRCRRMRFDLPTEIEVFRIAQEALSNAMRHGTTGQADVLLSYSRGQLTLTVHNDSCTFDAKDAAGFGLQSMHERAEALGGRLEITCGEGRTTVRLTVKVEPVANIEGVDAPPAQAHLRRRRQTGKK